MEFNKKLLLLHGANLNKLGMRDVAHYGHFTLSDIEILTTHEARAHNLDVIAFQSNHEGVLIDLLQTHAEQCHGIIINPGAFAHYSYALHDALLDTCLPVIEVHLSKIEEREAWRRHSVISPACVMVISGEKEKGYRKAVKQFAEYFANELSI